MTSSTGSRSVFYSGVVLVGAGAVFGAMMFVFSPTSSAAFPAAPQLPAHTNTAPVGMADMPGMDHRPGGMATGSPSPTTTDSPWKAHDDSESKPHSHGSGGVPGTSHPHGAPAKPVDRPLAPVLGVFGGGTSAVMLSAGLLRHRDRARSHAKQAVRDARRSQK